MLILRSEELHIIKIKILLQEDLHDFSSFTIGKLQISTHKSVVKFYYCETFIFTSNKIIKFTSMHLRAEQNNFNFISTILQLSEQIYMIHDIQCNHKFTVVAVIYLCTVFTGCTVLKVICL